MMSLGVDIGGSHVTASVIDLSAPGHQPLYLVRKSIDSFGSAFSIVETIGNCIREVLHDSIPISEIGVAFPGPFDYEKGVSTIRNVGGKFEKTFGVHIKQALKDATGLAGTLFHFSNDAHCFAVGAYARAGLSSKRTVFLTLGTGLGSAFMENGQLITSHPAIPASGALYNEPFLTSNADDYFSTRWFHQAYKQATGNEIAGVQQLAEMDTDISKSIFNEFGDNLGSFLLPWLDKFGCDELVIGGNIAKASPLFVKSLREKLASNPNIIFCEDTEECILSGAAFLAKVENSIASHDIVRDDPVVDLDCNGLIAELCNEKVAMIDGDIADSWEIIRGELHNKLCKMRKCVLWYDINACLQSGVEASDISTMDSNNLSQMFDHQKMAMMRPDPAADLCIVYGTGAALSEWKGKLVHLNLARKAKLSVV